jgi:regulator of replication initiation timing
MSEESKEQQSITYATEVSDTDIPGSRKLGFEVMSLFGVRNSLRKGMAKKRCDQIRTAKKKVTELERLRQENAALRQENANLRPKLQEKHREEDSIDMRVDTLLIREIEEFAEAESIKERATGKTKLKIAGVEFSEMKQVNNFIAIFKNNKTLTELDAYVSFEDTNLFNRFVSVFTEYKALQKICIEDLSGGWSNPVPLFKALENYSALKELTIGNVDFSVWGNIKAFWNMLNSNRGLTLVGLLHGNIPALNLRALLEVINKYLTLEILDFSLCPMGEGHMEVLAEAVRANTSWATICLGGCFDREEIGAGARQTFIDAVKNNTCLREVIGLPKDLQRSIQPYLDRNKRTAAERSRDVTVPGTVSSSFSSSSSSSLNASTIPLASDKGQDSRKRQRESEEGKGSGADPQQPLSKCWSTFLPPPSLLPSTSPLVTFEQEETDLLPSSTELGQPDSLGPSAKKAKTQSAAGRKAEEGQASDLELTQPKNTVL